VQRGLACISRSIRNRIAGDVDSTSTETVLDAQSVSSEGRALSECMKDYKSIASPVHVQTLSMRFRSA